LSKQNNSKLYCFQQIPEDSLLVSLTSFTVIATASEDDMILNWPVSPNLMVGPQVRKPFFPAHSSGAVTYPFAVSESPTSSFQSLVLYVLPKGTLQQWKCATLSCALKKNCFLGKVQMLSYHVFVKYGEKSNALYLALWLEFQKFYRWLFSIYVCQIRVRIISE